MKVELTRDELELAADALDSHKYWQLSDESRRDSGYVCEPLTDEERACETLEDKLRALLREDAS